MRRPRRSSEMLSLRLQRAYALCEFNNVVPHTLDQADEDALQEALTLVARYTNAGAQKHIKQALALAVAAGVQSAILAAEGD